MLGVIVMKWKKKYREYIRVKGVINQGTDYGHTVFNMSQIFRVIWQIGQILLSSNWGIFFFFFRTQHLQFGFGV